jgi:pimeloyl-ACP methyl ester carboxylesterase
MRNAVQEIKPNWPIPPELKWQPVNGYPMSYRDIGEGQPIVLVHGSIVDYRSWRFQFEPLGKKYRLIAVNLRRHYPEEWNGVGSDYAVEQHGSDVAALIKKLNLGRVHLVGWSRGGAVAVEIAKRAPEVIGTLVLVDGSIEMPVADTPEGREASAFRVKLVRTVQEILRTADPSKAAEVFIDGLNGPGTWQRLPELSKGITLANIYTALGQNDRPIITCDDVRKFNFPVLLMTGEKSPKRFEFFYDEMRKCKKFPPTVVIPNAAHSMQVQNPTAFNDAILTFIGANRI